jgi:hypothetical protein
MSRRSKLALLVGSLGLFVAAATVLTALRPSGSSPPVDNLPGVNEHVGKTMPQILKQFGEPGYEWDGHFGNPRADYAAAQNPARSFVYNRQSGGTLYLSFERRGSEWVCFTSHWLPKGGVF